MIVAVARTGCGPISASQYRPRCRSVPCGGGPPGRSFCRARSRVLRAIRQADLARLHRLGSEELQRMTFFYVIEKRLASAQDNWMHHQSKLIDQAAIQQTADQR